MIKKFADRIFQWYCDPDYYPDIKGDLEELYLRNHQNSGKSAKWRYLLQVLGLFRPSLIRSVNQTTIINLGMFRNYFKIGWRNLVKYRSYSMINIFGLSAGFGATLVLLLIINYEYSYDKFHTDYKDLYKVGTRYSDGNTDDMIVTPQIPLMREEYSDIIRTTRFFDGWEGILQYNNTSLLTFAHLVDTDFLNMFDFNVLQGNAKEAFSTPNQIILTKSYADKLFGAEDPMGHTVNFIEEDMQFTVVAIVEDPPKNSSLKFEVLIPWINAPSWLDEDQAGNWYNTFMNGYIQLSSQSDPREIEEKLDSFVQRHFLEERKSSHIALFPLADEHFRLTNNKRIISILGIIAGAILLISCLNFMNLSISQLLGRTKEIGVRKVMGSRSGQLIYQFIIEGLIVSSFAILIGLFTVYLVLPTVNSYFSFDIPINIMENQSILYFLLGICIFTILICSLWPSIALSGLQPINSMKGVITQKRSGGYFRKGLILLQFSSSILLIIGTVVIWSQIQFMKNRDLKFNGEHVVAMLSWPGLFKDPDKAKQDLLVLRDQLENETMVRSASLTQCVPGGYHENYNGFQSIDSLDSKSVSLRQITIDHKYFDTFKMNIIEGRNFSPEIESDKQAVIINETAMKQFGWNDLNERYIRAGGDDDQIYQVIGVVEDYYYQSLKRSIQPVIHFYNPDNTIRLAVRLDPERLQEGLAMLEAKWKELDPYVPFDYFFVDEAFNELYKEQERLGTTSSLFSLIAIIIAGLGLFSITAYTIRLRKKEIGIRKVLGASMIDIMTNLSGNFGILVLSAFVLACPVIYFLSDAFLEDFTYRIALSPWIFISGGALVFVTAMLIVGIQSGRAALENPVNSLKDE